MRYHHKTSRNYSKSVCSETYICNHSVYSNCTLYKLDSLGLAVIQQRYNPETKTTYWTELDPGLADDIYLSPGFFYLFQERAGKPNNGLYPTMTVRQVMWALKMKPLPKQRWETVFDRRDI